MARIERVGGTAFVVAEFRAEENSAPAPLYRDSVVGLFLSPESRQAAGYVKRFRLSFDYMADTVISKTTGDPGITRLVESFAAMGAPWLSGIRDIRGLARELGLDLIENFKTAELYQSYWLGRPMTSPIFNFYSVCTLGG